MPTLKGAIFDIDGVLEFQGRVYPGAVEILQTLRNRGVSLRFLTNSTLKSRASCTEKLQRAGFSVHMEEVVTASFATAAYLAEQNPQSCWVLLDGAGLDEFQAFTHDVENPEYVVVGDYRDRFTFFAMNRALRLILKGAKLVAMIPELIDHSLGEVELNVGSWAGMLERAAGVRAMYIGKPGRYVFDLILRDMNLDRGETAMVGDQVITDVRGGRDSGLVSVLLRTGEFQDSDLDLGIRPDFICDTIGDILDLF